MVAIASIAHIEPTLTIAPPPCSRHGGRGGLRDPVGRAQDRAERLLEVLLGLLEERDDAEDAGRVDEHVDAAVALDRGGDERLGLLARGDLAGVDVDALAARVEVVARRLELVLAGAAEHDARALVEEATRRPRGRCRRRRR